MNPCLQLLKRWGWVLLVVLAALGLWRVRFEVDVLELLPDNLPVVHGLKLYQKHFTNGRELVITVRAPDAESAESAARLLAESLQGRTQLVAGVTWQPPWLEHPEQLAELIAYLWLNQPPVVFAQLTNRLAPAKLAALLREAREQLATSFSPQEIGRLSYDPFGFTRLPETGLGDASGFSAPEAGFASADGTFRVVFVEARGALENYRTCSRWLAEIQAEAARCQGRPGWPAGVVVRYTGAPPFLTEVATGMERDMQGSVAATLLLIIMLFWWAHRSWRPLALLIAMLGLVVLGALAAGGLIFGRLNAISLGFAAILLGLAVDYGLVIYQEWAAAPDRSARQLRGRIAPSIAWSAVTTATAFGLLNLAGLPGLSQLGSLVAIGLLLAAVVMLYVFLPLVLRWGHPSWPAAPSHTRAVHPGTGWSPLRCRVTSLAVAGAALVIVWQAYPTVDHSTSPLQPRHSPAQLALDELQAELNRQSDPWLVIVSGRDEGEVARRLEAVSAHLSQAVATQAVRSFLLPTALWPHADRQQTNQAMARVLAAQAGALQAAAAQAGFTSGALALTDTLLRQWEQAAATTNLLWPTNASCRWLLKRAQAWTGEEWLAAGAIYRGTNRPSAATLAQLDPGLPGVWLTGWTELGEALLQSVEHRLWGVTLAMVALVGLCLWLAFRRWWEVLLSFATLGFSMLVLLAVMGLAGGSWNLMNLMALPLLLGAGVDYTIHLQLALRRHGGDLATVQRVTGRAVFLCAATTVAGFGSNAFSSNGGLASLGLVCAAGIAIVSLTSVFLLPAWWVWLGPPTEGGTAAPAVPAAHPTRRPAPASFYRSWLWRLGLILVRRLPTGLVNGIFSGVAALHFRLRPQPREVVIRNLLPACAGDQAAAKRTARRLYRRFAVKLADLWRVESGLPVRSWTTVPGGLDIIQTASARGRGVLFVTLHLGNWEHGGLLLAEHGIKLTVLTLAEPEDSLTEMRIASRARWGIETLIVGADSFALVEVIKRLQAGAAMAIAIDRPPERSDVRVELFGRPLGVSLVAAELARASGCALVGVTVVRHREGYAVKVLPEFEYDRPTLGSREARRGLMQKILRAFEPEISEHLDQWFQFVPIWPRDE